MKALFGFIFFVLFIPACALASDTDVIGSVKNTEGHCVIMRNAQALPAKQGTLLQQHDILQTGANSSMGVLLRDDTSLSLGAKSEVVLDEFVFDPANDNLGMLATFTKGTAAVLSGKIAQLAPEKARFHTPLATLGIRGTRFAVQVKE